MECRAGEGAPSGSFFLIKDGIGEDCGGRAHSACKVSSIPCHRPPQPTTTTPPPPPMAGVASLCLLFHLISRVHTGVRSCPLMLHSMQSLLCGRDCTVRAPPHSQERENIHRLTHFDFCLSSRGGWHFFSFFFALFKVERICSRCEKIECSRFPCVKLLVKKVTLLTLFMMDTYTLLIRI